MISFKVVAGDAKKVELEPTQGAAQADCAAQCPDPSGFGLGLSGCGAERVFGV